MGDKVLYFPYISVPDTAWFTRVLLFWDEVGTIVPRDVQGEALDEMIGPRTRALRDAGLVRLIEPAGDHIDFSEDHQIAAGFLELLARATAAHNESLDERNDRVERAQPSIVAPAHRRSPIPPGSLLIHERKMNRDLMQHLLGMGLAQELDGRWCAVEQQTAELYMAYLAVLMAERDAMDPITDRRPSLEAIEAVAKIGSTPAIGLRVAADQLQIELLEEVLPAPDEAVSVNDLCSFKRKHGHLLTAFRQKLARTAIDVLQVSDPVLRAEKRALCRRDLAAEVDQLSRYMHEHHWPKIVFGSFCGLVALVPPVLAAAGSPGAIVPTLPATAAGAYGAWDLFRSALTRSDSPLAYAVLAKDKFGPQERRFLSRPR